MLNVGMYCKVKHWGSYFISNELDVVAALSNDASNFLNSKEELLC